MGGADASVIEEDSLHFFGAVVSKSPDSLVGPQPFVEHVQNLANSVGAVCLGQTVFDFAETSEGHDQSGFTTVFLLAESHIAVHTWPEHGVAEIDVYLCNYLNDNRGKCEELFDGIVMYFDPLELLKQSVRRPRAERLGQNG